MDGTVKLRRSVQALAQPAAVMIRLFPGFVCVGDELALEFEEGLREARAAGLAESPTAREALQALDAYLAVLSGPPNEEFWLEPESLRTDERWETIRSLARATLLAFGWPDATPELNGAIYVSKGLIVTNR
jgi:hypothetical protein